VDTSVGGGVQFGFLTISGLVTEMVGDYRLPRNDHLNNYQCADTLFWTKAAHGFALRCGGPAHAVQSAYTSQLGGIMISQAWRILDGTPSSFNFAVPGRIDPDRGFRHLLRGFRARRLSWKPKF